MWRSSHNGANPAVVVGVFSNRSSEHIDTSIVTTMMQTAILNSGVLDFVAAGDQRGMTEAERAYQQSGTVTEGTEAKSGAQLAAAYMLSGTVNAMTDSMDNTMVRSYFVDAQLIEIQSNRIIWQGQNNEIKKVITNAKYKP
jgi:PBP1b-binding outer membrane lipoprotein LpoB